ncbi:hypothetical protein OAL92_00700 [bacterium]|nr:hypothetical protein [bacterium]
MATVASPAIHQGISIPGHRKPTAPAKTPTPIPVHRQQSGKTRPQHLGAVDESRLQMGIFIYTSVYLFGGSSYFSNTDH